MKAIQLEAPGIWKELDKTPDHDLSPQEVLVKVNQIGICGTDLHAYKGKQPFFSYPRILGHELAVEVLSIGSDVTNVEVGDRCSVEPYYNEEIGQAARRGKTNCGDYLRVYGVHVDGGMQESMKLPAALLHPSNSISDDQLAMIEPLAISYHAVERADIKKDDIVLIIGAGPIGLGAVQFSQLSEATVLLMDIDQGKLELAKELCHISQTLLASDRTEEELRKILNGDLPTIIIDATGSSQSMHNTFQYVSAGGTIVFVGLFQGDLVINDPYFHKKEITLKASRAALSSDFSKITKLIETGKIQPQKLITHRIGFDDITTEFEKLYSSNKTLIKAMISL